MKKSFITHTLSLLLLLLTASPSVYAASTLDEEKIDDNGAKLNTITSLSWSANSVDANLAKNAYYDGYTWYKYGDTRSISTSTEWISNLEYKYYIWKDSHAIAFKLAAGKYNINVKYGDYVSSGRSLKISHGTSLNEHADVEWTISNALYSSDHVVEVSTPTIYWVSGGSNSEIHLHAITVTKTGDVSTEPTTPPATTDATEPTGLEYLTNAEAYRWNFQNNTQLKHGDLFNDNQNFIHINNNTSGMNASFDGATAYLPWDSSSSLNTKQMSKETAIAFKLKAGRTYLLDFYFIKHVGDNRSSAPGLVFIKSDTYDQSATYTPVTSATMPTTEETTDGKTKATQFHVEITPTEDGIYWLAGATPHTSGIDVDFAGYAVYSSDDTSATPFTAIKDVFAWYYNGGSGMYSSSNISNNVYRYVVNPPSSGVHIPSDATKVLVDGVNIGGKNGDASKAFTEGSYKFSKGDALGFKLKAHDNTNDTPISYRIKIFYKLAGGGNTDLLKKGATLVTASNVSGGYVYEEDGSYITTYDITLGSEDEVYWIKAPANDFYLGGFEILPKDRRFNNSLPGVHELTVADGWSVATANSANKASSTQQLDSQFAITWLTSGSTNNLHVNAPAIITSGKTVTAADDFTSNTVMINNRDFLGFRIPANTKVKVHFTGKAGAAIKAIFAENLTATGNTEQTASVTTAGETTTLEYTATSATPMWITGNTADYVYFAGIELEEVGTTVDYAIDSDYLWYGVADKTLPDNDYTDADTSNPKTLHIGTALTVTSSKIKVNNTDRQAFTMATGHAIGFKVAQGKKGVINFFHASGANFTLRTSDTYQGAGTTRTTISNTLLDNNAMKSYYFDTTEGAETYWIEGSGNFAGFEVLFDDGTTTPKAMKLGDNWNVGSYKIEGGLVNALDNDIKITMLRVGSNPDYGPRRVAVGFNANTIMVNNHHAVGFKVPAKDVVFVNVIYRGATDNSLKLIKGDAAAPSASATAIQTFAGEGTGTATTATITLSNTNADDVYWVTGSSDQFVYLQQIAVSTDLEVIDSYHIWKAGATLADTNTPLGDCKQQYQGDGATYSASNKMDVLGSANGSVAFEDSKDYMAFIVDGGKKGHINVYYTGDQIVNTKVLPLTGTDPLNAGWGGASYNPGTMTISFNTTDNWGAADGWFFSNTGDDLSNAATVEIGVEATTVQVQLVAQDVNGVTISKAFPAGSTKLTLDMTQTEGWYWYAPEGTDGQNLPATFNPTKVTQIYIQVGELIKDSNNNVDAEKNKITLKSAQIIDKPVNPQPVLREGTTVSDDTTNAVAVSGGSVENQGSVIVYTYDFDLTGSEDQLYWLTGTMALGAIEVVFDSNTHRRVVEWYVNKDTKMIAGSNNPKWVGKDAAGESLGAYPAGYDEYVTFYCSAGRQAHVSFIMPQAVKDLYTWQNYVHNTLGKTDGTKIDESTYPGVKAKYGKHTITTTGSSKTGNLSLVFNRNKQKANCENIGTGSDAAGGGDLYNWYSGEVVLPNDGNFKDSSKWNTQTNHVEHIVVTATEKSGNEGTTYDEDKDVWTIYMRFVFVAAPQVSYSADINDTSSNKTGETVTIAKADSSLPLYYTTNSDEPINLANYSGLDTHTQTKDYGTKTSLDVNDNCIVKAAQYHKMPYRFYDDCADGVGIGNTIDSLKVVSKDYVVNFTQDNVVYVRNKDTGDSDLLNTQTGGYTMTLPTNKTNTANYNANPYMYFMFGSDKQKFFRNLGPASGWEFRDGGVTWKCAEDGGYTTYLDSYQYTFNIDKDSEQYKSYNENPYTEANGGIGGATTEDGGMFLQPISGDYFRVEPEYDGVFTLWIRQNGAVDHNTQEVGKITRRPTYIVDENGRIMRHTTLRPTMEHHMGINGVYAVNSGVSELRSTFEHTWMYGTASAYYGTADRFTLGEGQTSSKYFWDAANMVNDYRAAYIMYGMWYKGFEIDATRSVLTSAKRASRYEWMGSAPLYRDDWVYERETNPRILGLENKFAKYGYEVPNFTYVRYRFPVKAGKSYYLGGRGTRDGFVAMMFEPIESNINNMALQSEETNLAAGTTKAKILDYRFPDNPDIIPGTSTERSYDSWTTADGCRTTYQNKPAYSLTKVMDTYSDYNASSKPRGIKTVTITDNDTTNITALNAVDIYDMDNVGNVVGQTVNVVLNRTFTAKHWHPIVLPFSVSETRVTQLFGEGTVILYLDPAAHTFGNESGSDGNWRSAINPAIENSTLTFTYHRYQMLYANTPAFICPTFTWASDARDNIDGHPTVSSDGKVTQITFNRVTIDGTNLPKGTNGKPDYSKIGYAIGGGYEVVGTYNQTTTATDTYYISNSTAAGANVAHLYHAKDGNVVMKGTRVWIRPIPGRVTAPLRTIGMADYACDDLDLGYEQSGIYDIVADEAQIEMYNDDNVYDMLGRKVGYGTTDGLPQGVYIFQGRKVYVR